MTSTSRTLLLRPGGPRALLPLASAALVLTLAGCGGGDDTESSGSSGSDSSSESASSSPSESASESPSESASTEPSDDAESEGGEDLVTATLEDGRFTGAGYAFDVPDGWQDGSEQAQGQPLIGAVAFDPKKSDAAFADNLNVVVNVQAPDLDAGALEKQLVSESQRMSPDLAAEQRTEIAGEEAVHVSGSAQGAGGVDLQLDQYAAYSDDVLYILTLTHAASTPQAEQDADAQAVIDSWEWTPTS